MKAAFLKEVGKIEIEERPEPVPEAGEVVVKVEYCGICGSDVHGYQTGEIVPLGVVPGHECSGVVAKLGAGVTKARVGDRVVIKPIAQCNECFWCRKGEYSLCSQTITRVLGASPGNDGAFAEYVRVRYPDEMLFSLPDNVAFQEGALVEPLSVALHGIRMSRFRAGDRALVIGAGMIGLGVVEFLRLAGAANIIVLEVEATRIALAKRLGVTVLNPLEEGEGLPAKILGLTDGVGPDVVYECSGVPWGFQNALPLARSGGQIMVLGITAQEFPFTSLLVPFKELDIKGILCYWDEFLHVIEFLRQGKLDTSLFISAVIPLADIVEKGFKRLIDSRQDIKILVRP
jgi:(R,R)-butanediol dehydrogenase / meso-butanediol dehydrogenase / diacetyl reductase